MVERNLRHLRDEERHRKVELKGKVEQKLKRWQKSREDKNSADFAENESN